MPEIQCEVVQFVHAPGTPSAGRMGAAHNVPFVSQAPVVPAMEKLFALARERFGVDLVDISAPLGTAQRIRDVLGGAGFQDIQVGSFDDNVVVRRPLPSSGTAAARKQVFVNDDANTSVRGQPLRPESAMHLCTHQWHRRESYCKSLVTIFTD